MSRSQHHEWFRYTGRGMEHLVTHVIVDESLNTIPANAFNGRPKLKEVQLSETIESIERGAFSNCKTLKRIVIPESCKSIERNAFNSCSSLEEVVFLGNPPTITKIGHFCFRFCTSLKSIEFPNSIDDLGDGVLEGCKSLSSYKLPMSITSIRQSTFLGCEVLASLQIPDSVQVIDDYAFASCSSLNRIDLPQTVTEIRSQCFSECILLSDIHIPKSVQVIGADAFAGCTKLSSINFPQNRNLSIGDDAFARCLSLIRIEFPMISLPLWPKLFWNFGNRGLFESSPRLFERIGLKESTRNTCVFSFLQENAGQLFGYGTNENTANKKEAPRLNPFGQAPLVESSPSGTFAFGSSSFQFGKTQEVVSQQQPVFNSETLSTPSAPPPSSVFCLPSGPSFGLPTEGKSNSCEATAFSFGKSEAPAQNSRRTGMKGRLKGRARR